MAKNKDYAGIDYFRFLAALLVIAIHTSPLASFTETGDFILTRIIARTAVPFFFMASGFFLVSRYAYNAKKLADFIKKTLKIYGIATLIYMPVNIYSGYFGMGSLIPNIIKDIVFDGTFYHLWYLPASILGAVTAWYFVRKHDYKAALAAASVLYLIGLFGDSYYGLAEKIPVLGSFYGSLFQVSDYTRNGVFFAPVFFVLGGFIADNSRRRVSVTKSIYGFVVSFSMMFGEALILHYYGLQRHDSMYVFLPFCMYFLFHAILHFNPKGRKGLRAVSLNMYIVHPLVIVVVRFFAKIARLKSLLIENSIVHYCTVCLVSIIVSTAAAFLCTRRCGCNMPLKWRVGGIQAGKRELSLLNWGKRRAAGKEYVSRDERAYVEIDLGNLEHNVRVLEKAMQPKCQLMAVVKADAYGHGAFEVSVHLEKIGVRAFAVATIDEGIRLREYGIRGDILILGYTGVYRARELQKYNLAQTLTDYAYADALNRQGVAVKAHIKIDTGMHRLGIDGKDYAGIKDIFLMKNLKICGMYTHLCCSQRLEPEDTEFTRGQIACFYKVLNVLRDSGISIPKIHIQSSYGLLNYPELACDYVRAGIALYGVHSSLAAGKTKVTLDLRPVLSLKARVILIRQIRKNDSVGYDRAFRAKRDSRIAILPIGYADGFPRNVSGQNGKVLINGQYAPIVGRICMDSLSVDITEIKNVSVGDVATLISTDTESGLSAPCVADSSGSISNELLCRIGKRLPVITL